MIADITLSGKHRDKPQYCLLTGRKRDHDFRVWWKVTTSLVMPVYPSVCLTNFSFAWSTSAPTYGFSLNLRFPYSSKIFLENLSSIKIWRKKMDTLQEFLRALTIISRWILLRMRNVSDKNFIENQNTHFMFSNSPPPSRKSCRFWHNIEKQGWTRQATGDNIIRLMHFTYWITKATDTLRICNTYRFFMATVVMRTRFNITFTCTLLSRIFCQYFL